MGAGLSGPRSSLSDLIWPKKKTEVLMTGLDMAGKTTLLYKLKRTGEVVTTIPTIGFNVETVRYKNLNLTCWDINHQEFIRRFWTSYCTNAAAIIFVVDSADAEYLTWAAEELSTFLNQEELNEKPLLVFANKQDKPGAKSLHKIIETLNLEELRDRIWKVMPCSGNEGRGINEGLNWLMQAVQNEAS